MPPSTHRFGLAQLETARCLREHPEAEAALAATAAAGGYDAGVYAPSWAPKLEGDAGCLAGLPSWVQRDGLASRGEGAKYLRSVYFAITVLSTVGYGDIRPRSESEVLFMVSSHHLATSRLTSPRLASPRLSGLPTPPPFLTRWRSSGSPLSTSRRSSGCSPLTLSLIHI